MIDFEPNGDIYFKCSCCGKIVNNGVFSLRLCFGCSSVLLVKLSTKLLHNYVDDLKNKQDSN